jgi:hypothetical protein
MNIHMLPLNSLIPSPANVRKTGVKIGLDELAASIAAVALTPARREPFVTPLGVAITREGVIAGLSTQSTSRPIGTSCYGSQHRSAPAPPHHRPCSKSCRPIRARMGLPRRCARSAVSSARCSRLIGSRTRPPPPRPSCSALVRAVYFCRLGEVRDRSFEN